MNFKIKIRVSDKQTIEVLVYRSLPPIKFELKSVDFGGRPGGFKKADKKEITDAANAVRDDVQREAGDDQKFDCYEPVSGTKQVCNPFYIDIICDNNHHA